MRQHAFAILLVLGVCFTLAALFHVMVTVAGNDYGPVLRRAMVLSALALMCLVTVALFKRGRWRLFAILSALPLIYVALELSRRW
jgi:hypothetical protein